MKNLRIYFSLVLLNNFWFITSNWLNFWLKYMSLKEVGIIDGIAFLIGIMFEFPSGIISDRWGRKNSLILSQLFQFAGSFVITFASNLYEIGVGFIIFQIGVSMFSGSIESFGYESSRDSGYNYKNTLSISSFFNNFGYLFSLVVGGYFYLNNNNIPNYLFTMNFFLGLLICYFIMEKNASENSINSHTIQENNIKTDFERFFGTLRKVDIKLILYLTFLSSVVFAFDYGFVKLLLLEAFSDLGSNYLYIFGFTLFSLILSFFLLRIKTPFVVQIRVIFILLVLITFFVSKSYEYTWVIFAFLSFITVYISQISLSYFNELVSDDNRAGFLSIFALFYKLPYVFIALILGDMMQKISVNQLFYPSFLGIVFMYLVGKLGYNIAVNKWGRSSVAE